MNVKDIKENQILRGDIFYILPEGCDNNKNNKKEGKPAVIVSNNLNNEHSPIVEVVYLTTKIKKWLPTHVHITGTGQKSTALCEQVNSIGKNRLGDFIGHVYYDDMSKINKALKISLSL